MKKFTYKTNEYLVLIYRFALMMIIFSLCRIGFYLFNADLFPNVSFSDFMVIMKGGLKFDVSALIYLNLVYIFLYLLPFKFRQNSLYQNILKWIFYITNGVGLAANVSDFIYYKFTLRRTTFNVFQAFENEDNLVALWLRFIVDYWQATLFWVLMMSLVVVGYGRFKSKSFIFKKRGYYFASSLFFLLLFSGLAIIGMRGGYKHSTRPITMSNAGVYVKAPEEMALVVNTPFSILRTIGKTTYKELDYFSNDEVEKVYSPVFQANDSSSMSEKMNVVVFIMESFNRENSAFLNPTLDNGEYKGYTPFLDSLMQHSYVFANAFANGRKSIDAMPSILVSLPALVQPYILSEYSSNSINGLGGLLNSSGYHTSFFHGAPNGSMGFDSFANLAGFEHYFGKNEYNNDADYDGIWGIWDEPFFQYFAETLTTFDEPFATALFSLSSHHPFKVPKEYENVFPKGTLPIHQCVGYSDNALRNFFNKAQKTDWYDNTIFIITADHSVTSYYPEYKTNINAFAIPLIIHSPKLNLSGIDYKLAQQTDILPTILSLLDFNNDFISFGNNLFDSDEKDRFVLNYVSESYQFMFDEYVYYFDGEKITSYYNYIEDPFLTKNLIGVNDVESDVENKLKAIIQQYINRMINNKLSL